MLDRCEVGEVDANLEALVQNCVEATKSLKILTWEAIRRERFSITPEGLFDEQARTAESLLSRADHDTARREQFLSEAIPGEADGGYIPPTSPMQRDKYGLDLEEFKEKSGHAPQNWHKSVRQASAIIIDDMRARLEMHYDDVHVERWRQTHGYGEGKPPERKGTHKVFASVVHTHRKKLNQGVALHQSVTSIFQRPEDELCLHKLEKLRLATSSAIDLMLVLRHTLVY